MSWTTCQSMDIVRRAETNICPRNNIVSGFRDRNDGWVRIRSLRNVYAVNILNEGHTCLRESAEGQLMFHIRWATHPHGRGVTPQFAVTFDARTRLTEAVYHLLLCGTDVSLTRVDEAPLLAGCRVARKSEPKATQTVSGGGEPTRQLTRERS